MASSALASTTSRLILRPISDAPSSTASNAIATATPTRAKSSGSPNAAAIAGGTVGALIGLGIIALIILECFIRKRWVLLRRERTSTAPTTDNVGTMTVDVFGGSSEGTTAIGSHGDHDMRRMSQVSKGSGGSGRSQKVRFEGSQTITSVV